MKKLLVIALFLGILFNSHAQQFMTVKGQIIDKDQEKGVPYALVKINNSFAYANIDGFFESTIPPSDQVKLEASQLGYETIEKYISSNFDNIQLKLASRALILEEVLISDQPHQQQTQSDVIVDATRMVSQARDVGDLFDAIPGFNLIKKGGFALDPVFRSFKYEQLNLIYDGGIQTTYACPGRMDPSTTHINPQDVEKIELIRGPFSVRYGATMGAIVNVVTETFDHDRHPGWGGSVEGGFETNGNAKITKLKLHGSKQKFDFSLSGGLKDFGSYQSGNGTSIPSSFKTYDYNLKAAYNPNENQRLQINWRQAINRDILHAGLAMDTDSDDSDFLSIDYNWKNISPKIFRLNLKAYGTQVDHIMTNHRRPNFMMVDAVASVSAQTAGGKAELSLMPSQKMMIYIGSDYRYIGRDGERVRLMKRNRMTGEELPMPMRMVDAIWQNSQIQDAGIFVEGRYFPSPQWTFSFGTRLDLVKAQTNDPAADFSALYDKLNPASELNWSGTASASFNTDSDWNIQFAAGRGVRTANMIERYINHFTIGLDPYEYVGNPNLNPEINNQIEFSLQKQQEQNRIGVNVFYSYLKDYITAEVDPSLARKYMGSLPHARRFVNIDEAVQYGFEFSGQVQIASKWRASTSVAYTHAQNLDWDEPLAEISPLEAILGLRYEKNNWWLDGQMRLVDNQDRISTIFNESTTPGYSLFDFRAGIEPLENWSIGFAILNVFDHHYREHLNRVYRNAAQPGIIYEPGRNFTFFTKVSF